jgi:hypothetical protein
LLEEKISVKLRSCKDLGIVSGCSQESNFDFEKEVEKETKQSYHRDKECPPQPLGLPSRSDLTHPQFANLHREN